MIRQFPPQGYGKAMELALEKAHKDLVAAITLTVAVGCGGVLIEPGDVLELECEFLRIRGPIAKGQGRATVGGDVAVEAMLLVSFILLGDSRASRKQAAGCNTK